MVDTIIFTLRGELSFPLEVENINPDKLAGLSMDEVLNLPVFEGKVSHKISDYFDVTGNVASSAADMKVIVKNSSMYLRRIGEEMSAGEIEIDGDAGMHVGDTMSGGKIVVSGSVDHYAGVNLKGGVLTIGGDAGNYLGGAYRGDWRGMSGGKIIVGGNAGFEIGAWMRGTKKTRAKGEPLIRVDGNCGLHPGHHNHGGYIVIGGDCEGKAGSEMGRGDIIVLGKTEPLASFVKESDVVPDVPEVGASGPFVVFKGDAGVGGKGKLYIKK
ncbi:MAG: formylmethanofuran dehydrogenase subunit C [Promethearchaeota archaeon]